MQLIEDGQFNAQHGPDLVYKGAGRVDKRVRMNVGGVPLCVNLHCGNTPALDGHVAHPARDQPGTVSPGLLQ